MSIETWTQLKDALASNATGTFDLREGTFECDDGIILENKSDITIRGAGRGRTFIRVKKTVPDCFRIWSNVHNVTFSNFTMIGEVTSGTERIDRVGDYLHIIQNGSAHLIKPNSDKKPTTSEAWPYTVLK